MDVMGFAGTSQGLPFPQGLKEKKPPKINLGFAEGRFVSATS